MKQTMNRLFARIAMLCVAVILGGIAVRQAQLGLDDPTPTETVSNDTALPVSHPIPNTGESIAALATPSPSPDGAVSPFAEDSHTYAPESPDFSDPPAAAYADEPPQEPIYNQSPDFQYNDQIPQTANTEAYDSAPDFSTPVGGNMSELQPVTNPADDANSYLGPPAEAGFAGEFAPEHTDPLDVTAVQYEEPTSQDLPPILPPTNRMDTGLPAPPAAGAALHAAGAALGAAAAANELPRINHFPDPPLAGPQSDAPITQEVGYPGPGDGFGAPLPPSDQYPEMNGSGGPITAPHSNNGHNAFPQNPSQENGFGQNNGHPQNNGFNQGSNTSPNMEYGSATLNLGGERLATPTNQFNNQPSARMANVTSPNVTRPLGSGKPGPIALEGPQTPTLVVTKNAPPEIQVGKVAKFEVTVRNVGTVDAKDVVIRDEVPHGTRLAETNPPASQTPSGALMWEMGTIKAGGEATVVMQIMPTEEGDIGSVATVSFQAAASAKSIATRPQLTLEQTCTQQALIGDNVIFHIKLSNPGSGVATNVVLSEEVPAGLQHTDGRQLEYQIGTMRPGETRLLELTLKADQPGMVDNVIVAKAEGNLQVEDHCSVEIIAPSLQVGIEGPRRRYLERKATFHIQVANPGTAPAHKLELIAQLPHGLKFVSTNNAGHYNAQNHSVRWSLEELPAKEMGIVELTTLPLEIGNQRIHAETKADMGLSDVADHDVTVEGLAAILFTVSDKVDPIEVGGQTTYDIRVVNQGSKVGTNVRLAALIPPGMTPINGEGPTRVSIDGQRVMFEAIPRLAPQADANFKIHVKGNTPGDQRVQVQLITDEVNQPVTKEESTHVYADH